MSLTDRTIQSLKATGKVQKHFDGGGLYVHVSPVGGKLWRLAYRFGGKSKLLSFGAYPAVSLKMARDNREEAKTFLAKGIDPGEHKKDMKKIAATLAANTFEALAREWHTKFRDKWNDKHAKAILSRIENDILPFIGRKPIKQIKAPDLLEIVHHIRPMSDNTINAALRRLGYSREEMTGHGFRSMASTLLNEQGWNRDAIERQLAHGERDAVRAAYNFAEFLPERRKMMQAWADYLDTLKAQR